MKKTIEKLIKLGFGVSQIGGYEPLSTQFFYLSKNDKAVIIKIDKKEDIINFVKFQNDEVYCYAICGDYSNGKADKPLRKTIGKIIYQMGQELVHTDNFIPEKYRGIKIDLSKKKILKVEKERDSKTIRKSPFEHSTLNAILEASLRHASLQKNELKAEEEDSAIKKFNETYSTCPTNHNIKDYAERLWQLHAEAQTDSIKESCCTDGCKQEKFSDDFTPKHEIKNPMGEFDLETVSNLLDAIDRFGQKVTVATFKPQQKVKPVASGSCACGAEQVGNLEDIMMALKMNFEEKPYGVTSSAQSGVKKTCTQEDKRKLRKFNLQTFIKNVWAEVFNGGKDAITFRIIGNKTIQFYGYSTELNAKYQHLWMVTINIASLDDESVPFISNVNIYDSNVRIQDIFNPNHNIEVFVSFYRKFKKECV